MKFDLYGASNQSFKPVREALAAADNLTTFAEFHGNKQLVQATSKVTTLHSNMRDISLKQTASPALLHLNENKMYVLF